MKFTLIIFFVLIVQVSSSFLDVFQGAMHSVQNSFGKLLNDVVTDVKETVDCTILAIEHVFSLSADATALYNEKCGNGSNTTVANQPKENNAPTLEISFLNNPDYLNKLLPEDIDTRINDTIMRIFHGYNPHDKLADVERELAEETKRLASISDLVKQELEKLSAEIHIDLTRQHRNDSKPSVDNILQELRLLEAVEQNIGNSSEANEIHKVVENVLHKLNEIEASEVSENGKVDKILKDLESNSNGTYKDLRKRLEDWKNEEGRHLDLIKKKIEEHKANPEHSAYIEKNKLDNILQYQPNSFINYTGSNSSAEVINTSTHTPQSDVMYNSSKMISSTTTSLVNATTSTISTTLPIVLPLPKNSSDSEFNYDLANATTATVPTTLIAKSLAKSSSTNELAHVTSLPVDHTVLSTDKIKFRTEGNMLSASGTPDSRAALNVTPSHGAITSLPNITISTVSTTLATTISLAKKSSTGELSHVTTLTSDQPVASMNTTTPNIELGTNENTLSAFSTTDSRVTLNATPTYVSTTSLPNITTSSVYTTLAIEELITKKSSTSDLAHIIPLTSDQPVESTSTSTLDLVVDTTSLPNITTSTVSTTLAITGSMAKKSSTREFALIIPLTSNQPVASTRMTTPKIEHSTKGKLLDSINTVSRVALNATLSYESNTKLPNITTSTVSTIVATAGAMTKNSSTSELAHSIPLTSDQLVALISTRTPKIELGLKGNILPESNTTDFRAPLNATPSYGSTTSLPNITTSTVPITLGTSGSLARNSFISELVHITHVTSAEPVATTNETPKIQYTTESTTTISRSTTSSANVNISTISATVATVESLQKNSSANELADITPLTSDTPIAPLSTTTPNIEVRTRENIVKNYSITDSGVHSLPSLSHNMVLLVNRTTTPALSSSLSVSPTPKMSSPQLKTTVKTYTFSTRFNDSEKSKQNNTIIRKSTESNILLLKSPTTVESTIVTAEQITTPIGRHKLSTTTQIDDEVNTTPVSITTSSYVNKQKSSITETILNTDSSTMINSIANTLNQDLQPDYKTLTTIAPSTTEQMAIVDEDASTTSATTDVTSDISTDIPTTQQYHANDSNFSSTVAQSTIESTPSRVTLKLSKHHTITTPTLDAFLKYVDRIITSTPISTTKSKDISDSHIHKEMQDPWLTHSQNILSRATPDIINSNSIAPLNDKVATRPYDHSDSHLNRDIPSLTAFKPLKTAYNDPSLLARNSRFMNQEKILPARDRNEPVPDSNIPLPSRFSLNKGNIPFPYARINNDNPFLKRNMPRSSLLNPTHTGHEVPVPVINNKGPVDMFNHKSDTHRSSKPKLDNFDDPDYDSFFHLPSKDAEHERALREARKLIEDSQKAHRVMQRLLSRNKKGRNAYNLQSSLKFGK